MENNKPHRNLEVWKDSISFVKELYELTSNFPEEEKYNLVSQIRRAAVSIPANIAEGAARQTQKEFLQYLHVSSGSVSEIDTLLEICKELSFLPEKKQADLQKQLSRISAMLNGLIKKVKNDVNK
jgi:four helix bundle protein